MKFFWDGTGIIGKCISERQHIEASKMALALLPRNIYYVRFDGAVKEMIPRNRAGILVVMVG